MTMSLEASVTTSMLPPVVSSDPPTVIGDELTIPAVVGAVLVALGAGTVLVGVRVERNGWVVDGSVVGSVAASVVVVPCKEKKFTQDM